MNLTPLTTAQKVLMVHALIFIAIAVYIFTKYLLSALKTKEVWNYDKYGRSTMFSRNSSPVGYWMLMAIYGGINIFVTVCWLVGLCRMFL